MGVVAVAGLLALAPVSSTVYAATSAVTTNNTATKNDLLNADIIDESKTGSISIYKYDITAAEAAGEYKAGTYKATGEADSRVESALKDYAIEGVQFSYLRVGNVETHSVQEGTGTTVELLPALHPLLQYRSAGHQRYSRSGYFQEQTPRFYA